MLNKLWKFLLPVSLTTFECGDETARFWAGGSGKSLLLLAAFSLSASACDKSVNQQQTSSTTASVAASAHAMPAKSVVPSLQPQPNAAALSPDDPRLLAAKSQAQASLSHFIQELAATSKTRNRDFALLVSRTPAGTAPATMASVASAPPAPTNTTKPAAANASGSAAAPAAPGSPESFDVWLTAVKYVPTNGGTFTCRVNKPRAEVPSLKPGQEIAVPASEIRDWRIMEGNGKVFGSFTLRATLPLMPEHVRAAMGQVLQPLPTSSTAVAPKR